MTFSIAQSFHASYHALRSAAVAFDRTATTGRLVVSGPDRLEWLQGLLTNDIASLEPGAGCYATYLTPQGRMIGDMRVMHRGDTVVLDVQATARETLLSRLDQFIIMEDVSLSDATDTLACVSVAGPTSAEVLEQHAGCDPDVLGALDEHHQLPVNVHGADGFCAATRELGGQGYDVYLPTAAASLLLQALGAAGIVTLAPEVVETARIEAGRPRFGVDMDHDTIPLEAGIESRAISLTKGCYVGQEVVIRVLHRGKGRVARRLCWLVSTSAEPPTTPASSSAASPWRAGAAVRFKGKAAGRVTSACWSPARQRWLAIGMLHRDAFEPGTEVEVDGTAPPMTALVERLP